MIHKHWLSITHHDSQPLAQNSPSQQSATFLLFFANNLPIKLLEQVKIAQVG
jgi:hypothetical protein